MSTRPWGHCGLWLLWSRHCRAGLRGPPFEDASNGLANNSVRPSLFSGTKHPSACGQLEGRLGTQDGRDHLLAVFIPRRDPSLPLPPFYALTVPCGAAFRASSRICEAVRAPHNSCCVSAFTDELLRDKNSAKRYEGQRMARWVLSGLEKNVKSSTQSRLDWRFFEHCEALLY